MFPPCLITAAHSYGIPPAKLERIVETTQHLRRKGGATVGIGISGIQPGWLPLLKKFGFSPKVLKQNSCENLKAAAWILRETQDNVLAERHLKGVPAYLVKEAGKASTATGVPKNVLLAVAWQESGFDPNAASSKGAQGLMQFIPGTWARFGTGSPFNPQAALFAGARYLRHLYSEFHNWDLVFAGYNAGGSAVKRYGYRIPPYHQTEAYVPDILRHYWQLKGHLEPVVDVRPTPQIIESSPPAP